ncbi:MAG: HAD-IC family P-type ATPase [Desulfotomaculum sp.]|nr:HAD-IC family P-type ATPase [Desulfotomaculum sp.]
MGDIKWFQIPADEIMTTLETTPDGLGSEQATVRLKHYGKNELPLKTRGPLVRFLLQFHNPLLYVLMVAAFVAFLLSKILDMWVIIAVVLATVIIGFIQEGKAEKAIDALRKMMLPQCNVLRDGQRQAINSRDLVPGDIVLLEPGDQIPADLRLYQGKNLALDEAILTGESVPISKQYQPLADPGLTIAEQKNIAFSGTFVARGVARGIVVETATRTEMGKISGIITSTAKADPPILTKISEFTKIIIIAIFSLGTINALIGWQLGYQLDFIFLATVGIIVAMVPEGLPAALISAFSIGVTTMAKRNVLIRRLPAVETLGCTTVICSDKTGTLTKNQMTVRSLYCGGKSYTTTGTGYNPAGSFVSNTGATITISPVDNYDLHQTLLASYLCNDAVLINDDEQKFEINGDPTEGALLVAALKAGITDQSERLDEIPFDSQLQYMATLHKTAAGHILYLKGSPERVLELCSDQLVDGQTTTLNHQEISAAADNMASGALRVLGMAMKHLPKEQTSIDIADLAGSTFLGLQGMIDPPREEAVKAVDDCNQAGIRVIMITGDHACTAKAIANQLHIGLGEERTITGHEIETMTDEQLYAVVNSVSVYARAAPEHKYRIVKQLQRHGQIVAVTGDGVNDAPALSTADIGIAMGITGTQVTKEAADMVLADDNFASIIKGVEAGRHTFNNIWKVILFLLPTNGGQGLVLLSAIALAPLIPIFTEALPIQPIQILWVNLFIAIACAIPLTLEPQEPGILKQQPRNPADKLVNAVFIWKVAIVSVVSAVAASSVFLLYYHLHAATGDSSGNIVAQAQTAAFTTIIFVQVLYLFTARRITDTIFSFNPFSNKWLLAGATITLSLQVLIVYAQPLFGFSPFRTEPFATEWWLYIALAALPGFFVIELEKLIRRRWKKVKG